MIQLSQWAGLATNASPYALPPGATVEQVNLQCLSPGQLTARKGFVIESLGGTSPVTRVFLYHNNGVADIIYQRENGDVGYLGDIVTTAPSSPRSLTLAAAPQPPTNLTVGNFPGAPTNVTLSVIPVAPTGVSLATVPGAPTGVVAGNVPNAPTGVTLTAAPQSPTGVSAAGVPGSPTAVTASVIPGAPTGVSAAVVPLAPSGVSTVAAPQPPTGVNLTDPYSLNILQNSLDDLGVDGFTVTSTGNAGLVTSPVKYGSHAFGSDGTGGYISVDGTGTAIGTGDYTLEFWLYYPSSPAGSGSIRPVLFGRSGGSNQFYATLSPTSAPTSFNFIDKAGSTALAVPVTGGVWQHIAIVRSSGTLKGYVNGTEEDSTSNTDSISALSTMRLFRNFSSAYTEASVDSLRLSSVARYSSDFSAPLENFTPNPYPAEPTGVTAGPAGPDDPYYGSVALLLQDSLADESSLGQTVTWPLGAQATSPTKIGSHSFDLTSGEASVDSALDFGQNDFTVEAFLYYPSGLSGNEIFSSDTSGALKCDVLSTGEIRVVTPGSVLLSSSALTWTTGTWYHVVWERKVSGGVDTFTVYRDGAVVATTTTGSNRDFGSHNTYDIAEGTPVVIDALRVTIGHARYAGAYSVPTTLFSTNYPTAPAEPTGVTLS